ncbi:MAG: hypothetical protein ACXQTI_08805 [Candidatus Nezhaarchaeales archaeon]
MGQIPIYLFKDILLGMSRARIFNESVNANENILSSDIKPTRTPAIFRIYCCFNASGVLSVKRTKNGVTVTESLNGGNSLNANSAYAFDIIVDEGESINLQYSVSCTCLKLSIIELGVMV